MAYCGAMDGQEKIKKPGAKRRYSLDRSDKGRSQQVSTSPLHALVERIQVLENVLYGEGYEPCRRPHHMCALSLCVFPFACAFLFTLFFLHALFSLRQALRSLLSFLFSLCLVLFFSVLSLLCSPFSVCFSSRELVCPQEFLVLVVFLSVLLATY